MGSVYKNFLSNDSVVMKIPLYEAISEDSTIFSGTYPAPGEDGTNVKQYTHKMFESIYDYAYTSGTSNLFMDLTFGLTIDSELSSSLDANFAKKSNVYNSFAQVLAGYDTTGSVLKFDADGEYLNGGAKFNEAYFLAFSRYIVKDEIKKGTFTLVITPDGAPSTETISIADTTDYKVNSPAGEYGILYATSEYDLTPDAAQAVGLLYYQAGVVVLTASLFRSEDNGGILSASYGAIDAGTGWYLVGGAENISGTFETGTIEDSAETFRKMITSVAFSNTTEINSAIYFCRVGHSEFNYSSNPTYLSGSQIVVKEKPEDLPTTYITGIGLYNQYNELLAVGKFSEPLKKDSSQERSIRVRIDY